MAQRSNKRNERRIRGADSESSAGRQAVFFDLRREGEEAKRYTPGYTDDGTDTRPYREKHRVEVNAGNTTHAYGGYENAGRRGGTDGRVIHGNIPGGQRDNAGADTGREISADLFVPNTFSGRNARGRAARMPGSSFDEVRTRQTAGMDRPAFGRDRSASDRDRPAFGRGRSASDRGRPASGRDRSASDRDRPVSGRDRPASDRDRPAFGRDRPVYDRDRSAYDRDRPVSDRDRPAWGRSSMDRTRSAGERKEGYFEYVPRDLDRSSLRSRQTDRGRGAGQGPYARSAPNTGGGRYGRDYFYEDDLPSENLLWNGIDDDPEETASDKRVRQRERIKKEREKELSRMYFRLGIGAAAALFVIAGVIVFSVIRFRSQKTASVPETAGQTAQMTQEAGGTDGEREETASSDGQDKTPPALEAKAEGEKTGGTDSADQDSGQTSGEAEPSESSQETAGAKEDQIPSEEEESGAAADVNKLAGGEQDVSYGHQDEWNLILVNPWNMLPEGYTVETTALTNGESIDSRCYSYLKQMLEDCEKESGGTPIVCSSYRPHEKQVRLYEDQVRMLMSGGKTREEAQKEAGTVVALPGTSEHELGLAVDICDSKNQLLDDSQAQTKTQQWLMENCWNYGFILRYPIDKSELTGIIYEPWHYRYVGAQAAREIHERGICLEEYLAAESD